MLTLLSSRISRVRRALRNIVDCSLLGTAWGAQVYYNDILVQDILSFDTMSGFSQNMTALSFQGCDVNGLTWTGEYFRPNTTSIQFSYMRCLLDGLGCLVCLPTYQDWATISFSAGCDVLRLLFAGSDIESAYYAL